MEASPGRTFMMLGYAKALEVCREALVRAGKPTEQKHIEATYVVMTHEQHEAQCVYEFGQGWLCDPSCEWHEAATPQEQ